MRFFKSFNLHRRSKSDSAVANGVSKDIRIRTLSLPGQCRDPQANVFNTYVPNVNLTSSSNPVQIMVPSFADRINALELEKAQLNCTIEVLLVRTSELRGDLTNACSNLQDSLAREAYLTRLAKEDDDEIVRLEEKVARYAKFIDLMVDIGLHEAVLTRACGALRAGEDADEALIDSIKEAAAEPGSPWSKIIPAITGPRSSEEYIAAINCTLKVRRELKDCKKLVKFWKRVAKENLDVHGDTVTPSVSTISSIYEALSEERQAAVVDLVAKRNPSYFFRHRSALELDHNSSGPKVTTPCSHTSSMDEICPTSTSTSTISSSTSSKPAVSKRTFTLEDSPSAIAANIGCGPSIPNLLPLASESHKKESVTSQSYKIVSKRISALNVKRNSRTVLGELDLNRLINNRSSLPTSDLVVTQGSKRSAKALGKRKAIIATQNTCSIKPEAPSSFTPNDAPSLANCTASIPVADSFVEALSSSPFVVQDECQLDCYRIFTRNTAFEDLISSSATAVLESKVAHFPSRSFDSIRRTRQNGDSAGSLTNSSPESDGTGASGSHEHDLNSEMDCIILPDLSLMADSRGGNTTTSPPAKTAVVTPAEGSPYTPVKKSRLPMLKHHPFSTSPKFTLVSGPVFTRTAPLVIKKKKIKATVADVGVCSPVKQSPTTRWTPSRLPTLSKLLPIGLRPQARRLFDS